MALQYETTKEHTITVTGYEEDRKTSGHCKKFLIVMSL